MFHISLHVSNIAQSKMFYTQLFGGKPHKERTGYMKWELAKINLVISFIESPERIQEDFGHLGLRLASVEALSTEKDRLENAGMSVVEEMSTHCCYALQDKFWVKDPDGYAWEMYVFHGDSEVDHKDLAEGACCVPGSTSCETETSVEKSIADRLAGLPQEEALALLQKAMGLEAEEVAVEEKKEEPAKPNMEFSVNMFAKPKSSCDPDSGCC